MESSPSITPNAAAALLAQQEDARAKAQDLTRPFAALELWHTVFVAAYITTLILVSSATLNSSSLVQAPLLLLLAEVSLLGGAQQRYAVRSRARTGAIIAACIAVLGFTLVIGLAFNDIRLPWWVGLIAGGAVLVALGLRPAIVLARGTGPLSAPAGAAPLSTPARWVTSLIGLGVGLVVALTPWTTLASLVQLVAILGLVFLLVARSSAWGLTSVGVEWGRTQWTAFGVVTAALFSFTVAVAHLGAVSWPVSLAVGALTAAVMCAASFMRSR